MRKATGPAAAALLALSANWGASAAGVSDVEGAISTDQRRAAASQSKIDRLDDATRKALTEYRGALLRAEQLRLYKSQLENQLATQKARLLEVESAIERVEHTRAAMVPLLVKMVDALEAFVQADQPFAREMREKRVADLRTLLADPQAGLAEQYRAVYAAWEAEAQSGRVMRAERVNLPGAPRSQLVDLIQVGRLALYAVSLDGADAWQWDTQKTRFEPLPASALPALKQVLRVAQEQAAPELLSLPGSFPLSRDTGAGS